MQREAAETVGMQALAWLVGNDELLPLFLGSTGASLDDLRTGADDSAFLASVLDFLTMDDTWVMAFCDAAGIPYEAPMRARAMLPGGGQVHWT
jgi:hypothetical protein